MFSQDKPIIICDSPPIRKGKEIKQSKKPLCRGIYNDCDGTDSSVFHQNCPSYLKLHKSSKGKKFEKEKIPKSFPEHRKSELLNMQLENSSLRSRFEQLKLRNQELKFKVATLELELQLAIKNNESKTTPRSKSRPKNREDCSYCKEDRCNEPTHQLVENCTFCKKGICRTHKQEVCSFCNLDMCIVHQPREQCSYCILKICKNHKEQEECSFCKANTCKNHKNQEECYFCKNGNCKNHK
jgi:hypothetical protein